MQEEYNKNISFYSSVKKERLAHQKASLLYAPPALFRNGNMILFVHCFVRLYRDFDIPGDKAVFIKSSADFPAHIHGMGPVIVVIPLRHAEDHFGLTVSISSLNLLDQVIVDFIANRRRYLSYCAFSIAPRSEAGFNSKEQYQQGYYEDSLAVVLQGIGQGQGHP